MKFELRKSVRNMAKAGVLAGSLMGLGMVGQGANAAQGDVDVTVTFPPLVILYYYSDIVVDVDATELAEAVNFSVGSCTGDTDGFECAETTTLNLTGTANGAGVIEATADITTPAGANPSLTTTVDFAIDNAWAVRALGTGTLTAELDPSGSGHFIDAWSDIEGSTIAPSLVLTDGENVGTLEFDVNLETLDVDLEATDTITINVYPTP